MRLEEFNSLVQIDESIVDRGIFKAVFMGGSSGSGKSYVLSKIKSGSLEPRVVNIDTFIEHLGAEYYTPGQDRAMKITAGQLFLYVNSLLPLWIDATSTEPDVVIKRYNVLEEIGYDLACVFVNTSLETALKRVDLRNQIVNRSGRKRYVSPDDVMVYHNRAKEVKGFLKSKFPLFLEVNNDDGELTNEVILKIYKRISFFYDGDIKNPIGKRNKDLMKRNGWKYLIPNVYSKSELKGLVSQFYRS